MKYKCLVQFLGKCSVNVKSCPHEIQSCFLFFFFLKILLLLDRGKGREGRGKETSMCGCPIEDLAHNPGMCPDWELNQRPFALQFSSQSTEPQWPSFYDSLESSDSQIKIWISALPLICLQIAETHPLAPLQWDSSKPSPYLNCPGPLLGLRLCVPTLPIQEKIEVLSCHILFNVLPKD